jgi:hypothetical protein
MATLHWCAILYQNEMIIVAIVIIIKFQCQLIDYVNKIHKLMFVKKN